MRESELHRRIEQRSSDLHRDFDQVAVGPGDDAAVLRGMTDQLVTVDQLVVGRHVTAETAVARIGSKAIARSVSDIAAMAGTPRWAVATGLLPDGYEDADALFESMADAARSFGCPLVGGDIATGPATTPLSLTVTIGGSPHEQRGPVLRGGANAGDGVYVTGAIGESLASGWHLEFVPRVEEARWLADTLGDRLASMIDVSDGLGRDAGRIARASGVHVLLEADSIPLRSVSRDPLLAAGDGEDYELLFTASGDVPNTCATTGTPITRIGSVESGRGCVIVVDGRPVDATELGWDH